MKLEQNRLLNLARRLHLAVWVFRIYLKQLRIAAMVVSGRSNACVTHDTGQGVLVPERFWPARASKEWQIGHRLSDLKGGVTGRKDSQCVGLG